MLYRQLGNTGLKLSEIGIGGEHLEGKPFEAVDSVVNAAIDGGVNIIDIFMPQAAVRTNIGRAIGSRRDKVLLQGHIGAALQNDGQYFRTRDVEITDIFVKDFMKRLNTDYIDLGMIHFVDTEEDYKGSFETSYIDYVQKLKKDGTVRFIGASTHDAAVGIKMVETGIVDMLMFSINPAFDLSPDLYDLDILGKEVKLDKLRIDPDRIKLYNLCEAKGIGITVMKALGAGRLLKAESSSLGYALTLTQCISYALDRPAVSSVLIGTQTAEQVSEALAYENSTAEERDYAAVLQKGKPMLGGKCMYCNHCLPCPQGIDIAAVSKYLDIAKVSQSDSIRAHYQALSSHGGDCIECGSCEARCPFGVKVIENMREAARVFE